MTLFSGSLDGLKEEVFCAVCSFFTCSCDELLEVLWVLKVDFVNIFIPLYSYELWEAVTIIPASIL